MVWGQMTISLAVWHLGKDMQGHTGPTRDCLSLIQSTLAPPTDSSCKPQPSPTRAEKIAVIYLGNVCLQAPENASLSSRLFISAARAHKVLGQDRELDRGVPTWDCTNAHTVHSGPSKVSRQL